MGAKFRRASLEDTFFKSPFDGLCKHSEITKRGILELKKGIKLYVDEEFDEAEIAFKKVSKLEHEADKVKMDIWEHLPRFIFMPMRREDFMDLLKEADALIDNAENVSVLLPMRQEKIPEPIAGDFKEFGDKIFEAATYYDVLMDTFTEVLKTSFNKKSKEKVRKLHDHICQTEYEADKIEANISQWLFNYDEYPLTAVHLLKVVDRMDSIADHAENVADMLVSILESK
ncbi:MAG: DUF47 family protein [Thermoplasmata archaeon]